MRLGSGFAAGMQQGQSLAGNVVKMYQDAKLKSELAELAKAKPEESTGFTADQGKQLEGLARQGYQVEFDQGQNAYVARNAAGDTKTVAMQGVTDFLGERSAGAMGREQQDNTRMLAMSDVIGRTDPVRGVQMRQQVQQGVHAAKRQAREEKQWAREDDVERIEGELGAKFKASLVDAEGKPRAATADDYLSATQERAFTLMQGGHAKAAEQAMKDHMAQAHVKIQLEGAQRKEAAGKAAAALASGDYGVVADFYNRYVPSGSKVTGIEAGKDGQLVMNRVGMDGKALAPMTVKNQGEALAMLRALDDPMALYQYSQGEFQNQLALRREGRADNADRRADRADARSAAAEGRAAASHALAMQEKREIPAVREALAREAGLSETQVRAARAGVIRTPGENSTSREERMRYTSLLGETSRRLTEAQKALAALQKDPFSQGAKEGSPKHAELQGLRDTVAALSEERSTYQRLLAGSQGPAKAAPVAAKSGAVQKLPEGARQIGTAGGRPVYELPDGRRVVDQGRAAPPPGAAR